MATLRNRLERLEFALQFNHWFRFQRWLESMTDQEIDDYIATDGTLPEPFPDPPPCSTRLDSLDRKALIRLWEDDQRKFGGRSSAELDFYTEHVHWPEQACHERDCRKPAFDRRVAEAIEKHK